VRSVKIPGFSLFILLSFFIFGCDKQTELKSPLIIRSDAPLMSAKHIDMLFSDSGKIAARLTSPLLNRFGGEAPYFELPTGFQIFVYDSLQRISSTITGKKGIRHEHSRIMEAWGNVVVRNEIKNEQLNTEHLIWDENRHKIWSDVKVTITRPDQVITGTSMEANDTFTSYIISNMSGEMMVRKDSL
jgi:LPS export ABC transporter protein LptC